MLIDELRAQKAVINELASRYGASHVRLFGSVARGEETPDSDIDLLVDLPRGYDLFKQRLPLTEQLSNLFKRRVDLMPEHELNQHIRDQVLSEATEL